MGINKKQINKKQEIFVLEYLKDYNASRAYQTAYNCSNKIARQNGYRLLTYDYIKNAIQEESDKRLKELGIDVYYVIKNIKEVTEKCMEKEPVQYYDKEEKEWKDVTQLTELPNGEKIEATVMQFDSKNALRGLELLGKYKSLFKDNVSVEVSTSKKLKDVFAQVGGEGLDE